MHLFAPQILFTLPLINDINIGGSIVNIISLNNYNNIGYSIDTSIIIPLLNNNGKEKKVEKISFCIGAFQPVIYNNNKWLPTYSLDFRINI